MVFALLEFGNMVNYRNIIPLILDFMLCELGFYIYIYIKYFFYHPRLIGFSNFKKLIYFVFYHTL